MSGAGPTGGRRRWRVQFEAGGKTLTAAFAEGNDSHREGIMELFRDHMRAALGARGCAAFTVVVHPYGPECDHETGGGGGNAA